MESLFLKSVRLIIFTAAIAGITVLSSSARSVSETGSLSEKSESPFPNRQATSDSIQIASFKLLTILRSGNISGASLIAGEIENMVNTAPLCEEQTLLYPLYILGTYHATINEAFKALPYFLRAMTILDKFPSDTLAGKINYNLGYTYNLIGDDIKSELFFSRSSEYVKKEKGDLNPELVVDYLALSVANINTRNYERAIQFADKGLAIAGAKPDSVTPSNVALLYQTKGTALARISDYHSAVLNMSKALSIYQQNRFPVDNYFINLIDNLAIAYQTLGNTEKSLEFFEKGISASPENVAISYFNLAKNYASLLAEQSMAQKGEKVLSAALNILKRQFDISSRQYITGLTSYADYLRLYGGNPGESLRLFNKCFEYVRSNRWDINLNRSISLGYALSLMSVKKPFIAIDSINSILYREAGMVKPEDIYANPEISSLNIDEKTLSILLAKYNILKSLPGRNADKKNLESEISTAEMIISAIEEIRLNIGEEQSRLLLGDRYRNSYINVISSLTACYNLTGDNQYIEKAFEYSERSKAASLLASLREMKAMKIYIPSEMVDAERTFQKEISYYSAKLEEENNSKEPDQTRLNFWETNLISAISRRDSLKKEFEKNYKGYFDLKYNKFVVRTQDVQKLTGKNKNYLSYVVSDSLLYIMIVNREKVAMETVRIKPGFSDLVANYRKSLSEPDPNSNARSEFVLFQEYGYRLYSMLIKPVERYLISDNLIISPDNFLSFFPFETLVTSSDLNKDMYYSRLDYLMNDYRISYAYSATLLTEAEKTRPAFHNKAIAFAPSYEKSVFVDSISSDRQFGGGKLSDLLYAREEATYVSNITLGKLCIGNAATREIYESEAGRYDILHMAMHTVLKDKDQINSGMIFSENPASGNRYLRPFEIYNIPLNAKMVVLSSCYTGIGALYAGEGVLSIARGFIFSGSRSVVMSLWEVDDQAGTEIVKAFYRQIKSGKPKSEALRNARLDFLKRADMLRSHPYFWSTLVVYGDDSPLYFSDLIKYLIPVISLLIAAIIFFYCKKR